MRIAFVDFVCDPASPGTTGLSDIVWDMAGPLARLGDEVHIVAPYTTDEFPDRAVQVHRFAVPPLGYRNIVGHLWIVLRAYRALRRLGTVDVVHAPEYFSTSMVASLQRTIPVVFTEPGNIFERIVNGNPYDWTTTQIYKIAARLAARNCAHCIATSELMRDWWRWTGVSLDRCSIVPLGLDPALFQPVPQAREELGWSAERPILLYAARLSRENGADLTLRAVAQLKRRWPTLQLHVVGAGPQKMTLQRLAEQLDIAAQVVWHNWIDRRRLPAFYSAADAFVFSGRSGGTPRVLLQAMACGAPVVAPAIGGIVDHVTSGETGLLFPAGDVEALAQQCAAILEDRTRASHLRQAAQTYVNRQLAWDVLIRRIRDIYMRVGNKAGLANVPAAASYQPRGSGR